MLTMLLLTAALLAAGAVSAAPMSYRITSGEIVLTASSGGAFLSDPVQLPVDGQSIQIDLATSDLVGMTVTGAGPVSVDLTPPLGGFDTLVVGAASITGSGTLFPVGASPPDDFEYFALIEDVVLSTSFTVIDSGTMAEEDGVLAVPDGSGSGSLFVSLSGGDLTLNGIVTASFTHPDFAGPITIKADIDITAVLIPEPTGAVIFGIGMLPVAFVARRGNPRRS